MRVYDFGLSEENKLYIAMERLEGITFEQRLAEGGPLLPGEFLEIFEQLLQALGCLHSNGIVHRDLKPANVMLNVGDNSVTHATLFDLGLAKRLGDVQRLTGTGALLGTPMYMSPEQCNGSPSDERSDLYSLGCMMYESVTGQPLFDGGPVEIMLAHGQRKRPDMPKSLVGFFSKLLAINPETRFQTTDDVLTELRRFEFEKWERFEKSAVTKIGLTRKSLNLTPRMVVVLVLAATTAAILCFNEKVRIDRESSNDRLGTIKKNTERDNGQSRKEAEYKRLIAASKNNRDQLELVPYKDGLVGLYTGEKRFNEAEALARSSLAIREKRLGHLHPEVAVRLRSLGWLCAAQNRFKEAAALYSRALQIRQTLSNEKYDLKVALCFRDLGEVSAAQGHYAEAKSLYERCLKIREQSIGSDSVAVAQDLASLSKTSQALGDVKEAEFLGRRCLQIREKALGPEHPDVFWALSDLASIYEKQGRYGEAEVLLKRSLLIVENPKNQLKLAQNLIRLGDVYRVQGKIADAKLLYDRCSQISESIPEAGNLEVAKLLDDLAKAYRTLRLNTESERVAKRALMLGERVFGPNHPDVTSLITLAEVEFALGKTSEAEALMGRSLQIVASRKKLDSETATVFFCLADLYSSQSRYAEAGPLFERALDIREKTLGANNLAVCWTLYRLANVYVELGKYERVEAYLNRALHIMEKQEPHPNPKVVMILQSLANFYSIQNRHELAERMCKRAIAIDEDTLGRDHPQGAWGALGLAHIYSVQGKFPAAEILFERSLQLSKKMSASKRFALQLQKEAKILRNANRTTQAHMLEARANEITRTCLQQKDFPNSP